MPWRAYPNPHPPPPPPPGEETSALPRVWAATRLVAGVFPASLTNRLGGTLNRRVPDPRRGHAVLDDLALSRGPFHSVTCFYSSSADDKLVPERR